MTEINIELGLQTHLDALNFAESLNAQEVDPNIAGKAGWEELSQYITPIWENIRVAIESAVTTGEAFAEKLWQYTSDALNNIAKSAGVKINELSEILRQRLSAYVKRVEKFMLESVSALITAGGIEMKLQSIDIQKSLKLSTSLKACLTSAILFAAGSEMSVKANYTVS